MTIFCHFLLKKYYHFMRLYTKIILIIGGLVSTLISILFIILILRINNQNEANMLSTARSIFKNILITRKWVSDFDGVFVHKQPGTEPNPYLPHPDLITETGDTLFLKNPALVTRELSELSKLIGGEFSYHLSSEKNINPLNSPDSFEINALRSFADHSIDSENEYYQIEEVDGNHYFRYFSPLYIDYSCLNCHSEQGYEYGDLRGGISVLISIDSYLEDSKSNLIFLITFAFLTIALMSAFIFGALQKTVIAPLKLIEESTQSVQDGNYISEVKVKSNDEIGHLSNAFNVMSNKIQRSTRELKLSESKYKSLIDHSIESIAIINNKGDILECNTKMSQLTGYSQTELRKIKISKIIDIDNKDNIQFSSLTGGTNPDTEQFETILFTKDALEISVDVYRIKEFSFDQKNLFSIIYIRDLSERKQIEKYTLQADKMFALGRLSAGIAHEIRNPLFALNNNIEYINENTKKEIAFNETYDELKASVEKIQKTVSTILDFSKSHKTEFLTTNINDIIKTSVALVKKQFDKDILNIDLNLDDNIKSIKGDQHQLGQVFINLLLNSLQAIGKHPGSVTITTTNNPKYLKITFSDTGIGISSEKLERIFDPFYSTFHNGTGLGLPIVQRILENHHATYKVESEEFIGTTFTILFRYKNEI